jgi:hypothetical protein
MSPLSGYEAEVRFMLCLQHLRYLDIVEFNINVTAVASDEGVFYLETSAAYFAV